MNKSKLREITQYKSKFCYIVASFPQLLIDKFCMELALAYVYKRANFKKYGEELRAGDTTCSVPLPGLYNDTVRYSGNLASA